MSFVQQSVFFHVGQAGVAMGDQFWSLMCNEHIIDNDGLDLAYDSVDEQQRRETLFIQTRQDRYVPRCLFVDSDNEAIQTVFSGKRKFLYHKRRALCSRADASAVAARAQSTEIGVPLLCKTIQQFRLLLEQSDHVNSIVITRANGGGTGSGLTQVDRFISF